MKGIPFVGRAHEMSLLSQGLDRAKEGKGSFWLVSGPVGIGKTSLLHHLSQQASKNGFRVLAGHAIKDLGAPGFPFEMMFRSLKDTQPAGGLLSMGTLPPLLILEEERPEALWLSLPQVQGSGKWLVLSRERAHVTHEKLPSLAGRLQTLHLSRTEGTDQMNPSGLDALGQRMEEHLKSSPGNLVAIANVEYLVVQNSFLAVLRLLQFLREVAEVTGGHVLISVNPRGLDSRERALLESEGEIVGGRVESSDARSEDAKGSPSPALRLLNYLERLEGASRVGPLLLTVDDLQWADGQSASALQFLARNSQGMPILLVGGMRTEEREGMHAGGLPVNEALDTLTREGLLHRLPLDGLPPEDLGGLVEGLIGGPLVPSPEGVSSLSDVFAPSHGNPFFVMEMTENLRERGWLRKEGDRWVIAPPTTEDRPVHPAPNLRHLVSRRLIRLSREERDMIDAAALIGPTFDMGPVAAVLGLSPGEVEHARTLLSEDKHLITHEETIRDRWDFVHPFVWEMILDEMPLPKSQSLSGRLAEWWSKAHPEEVDTVARLYYHSRSMEQAAVWVRKAAEGALRDHNGDAMVRYARWMLVLMGSQPGSWQEYLETSVRLAEGLTIHGSAVEAERLLRDLRNTDPQPPGSWRIAIALADLLLDEMRPEEALSLLETTQKEISKDPTRASRDLQGSLEVVKSDFHMRFGNAEMGRLTATHALELLGEEGDPMWRARGLDHLGWSLVRKNELEEAAKTFAQGRELCQRLGIAGYLAYHMDGMGQVELRRGNLPAALKHFQEASAQSLRSGDLLNAAIHLNSLEEGFFQAGKLEEAERTALDSLKISEQFDYQWISGRSLLKLGLIDIERKRWVEAQGHLALSVNRYLVAGEPRGRERAKLYGLRVRGELGDPQGALKELEHFPPGGTDRYLVRARLRELVGNGAGAARDLERAWDESSGSGILERARIRREQVRLEQSLGNFERARNLQEETEEMLSVGQNPRNP